MPNVELERKQEPPNKAYTTCSISPHPIKTVFFWIITKICGPWFPLFYREVFIYFHSRYLFPFSEPMSDFRRFHMATNKADK